MINKIDNSEYMVIIKNKINKYYNWNEFEDKNILVVDIGNTNIMNDNYKFNQF